MQKTKLVLIISFLLFASKSSAQDVYIIEGDTLQLTREVKGPLSLLWTQVGTDFRYFVQKEKSMRELTEEADAYKDELAELTSDEQISTADVKFVLYSLKHFVNRYNALVQEDYAFNSSTSDIQYQLSLFTGLSNNRYTTNPENVIAPILGIQMEFLDPNLAPRHSAFLQLRQSFKSEEYRYSATQLSLNYRFKFLYLSGFDLHVNAKLAAVQYYKDRVAIYNSNEEITHFEEDTGFTFTTPLSVGIGTDIKVTEVGFITIGYNDIVSLVLDSTGSFPVDFTIGYKYRL